MAVSKDATRPPSGERRQGVIIESGHVSVETLQHNFIPSRLTPDEVRKLAKELGDEEKTMLKYIAGITQNQSFLSIVNEIKKGNPSDDFYPMIVAGRMKRLENAGLIAVVGSDRTVIVTSNGRDVILAIIEEERKNEKLS